LLADLPALAIRAARDFDIPFRFGALYLLLSFIDFPAIASAPVGVTQAEMSSDRLRSSHPRIGKHAMERWASHGLEARVTNKRLRAIG
jgi:hypothetical protein